MKTSIAIFTTILLITTLIPTTKATPLKIQDPKQPKPWPPQFHAKLIMNNTKTTQLEIIDLYYDWTNGRNLNLIHHQLGKTVYDVEWNNGTSFYFTRNTHVYHDDGTHECSVFSFDVGILTPDWLHGATYLGQTYVDGFLCNVWDKVEFLKYYEDVATHLPVLWVFSSGRAVHVMSFEVGAVLEDSEWQAPFYCFNKQKQRVRKSVSAVGHSESGFSLLRSSARALL